MSRAGDFRERAFFEARRYGGDAWVFIRELLQNSRDAGAGRVDLTVERQDGVDRIVCTDDGCGMSFEHARRFLFTLYASSKADQRDTAGRFGIGFWSVLRFDPHEVFVRSATPGASGWQVRLTGDLEDIEFREISIEPGTEVELVRPAQGDDLEAAVWNAVRRDARHLRRRDRAGETLGVFVNSRLATTEIELAPPSLLFARRDLRGAVALAERPQVDLLAHGLRVRTTATLDELLTQPDQRRRRRRRWAQIPDGLAPRVILDSRRLQVLMARGDARTDRELRQIVAVGRRGVRRLVRGQLDQQAGLGRIGRLVMRGREMASTSWARRLAAGVAVAALLTGGAWWMNGRRWDAGDGSSSSASAAAEPRRRHPDSILGADVAGRYRGPAVDPFESRPVRLSLRYQPPTVEPMLAVFRVTSMDDDGRVVAPAPNSGQRPYLGSACRTSCIEVDLDLDGAVGEVRLPVPTGQVLDPASLQLEGGTAMLWASADGGPVLAVEEGALDRVRYRTGPGVERQPVAEGSWPALPGPADDFALELRRVGADEAARRARDWVRRRVVYDNSATAVERHRDAARDGLGFAERCLAVGAGDCDVQNTLLAAILARAGISVRLAVGFAGANGRALPGLHAWVEYRDGSAAWGAVDASRGGPPGRRPVGGARFSEPGSPAAAIDSEARPAVPVRSQAALQAALQAAPAAAIGAALVMGALGAILIARRRIVVHQVRATATPNLVGLLRGALARPEFYREVSALFSRRVVPVLGRRAISLDRARALARDGRLGVSTASPDLARRVAAGGLPVIDGGRPEGNVVASTLGAVDLDRWDAIIARGGGHPVADRLERVAAISGERWKVIVCTGLGDEIGVLEGSLSGLGRRHRLIAVDGDGATWRRVLQVGSDRPSAALLLLADVVVDRLRITPGKKHRLLSPLAAEAVIERTESRS